MSLSTNRLITCLLVILFALPEPASARVETPRVTCHACLVVDEAGNALFARRATVRLPNASTTKMVTALVVVRSMPLDTPVEVSAGAAATGGGGLDLHPGEVYSAEDLLYALLLTSSNDAAVALAEAAAGSEGAFVEAMNSFAARRDLNDTHFVTPHGLDAPAHYSSARDLAASAALVLDDPALSAIVASAHATIEGPQGAVTLDNRNVLLESYRGAVGVKTGFTSAAGEVLVAAAQRRGRRLIAVAMDAEDAARDSRALLDFGFDTLARTLLVAQGTRVATVVWPDAGAVEVVTGAGLRGIERPDTVALRFEPDAGVSLPIEPGEVVGDVVVSSQGVTTARLSAVAADDVSYDGGGWAAGAMASLLRWGHEVATVFS